MSIVETVERVVAPVLLHLGIELVDVESHPGHLKITIDRSSGLDLAAIGQAAGAISHALDAADAVPGGRYELEVSSPGVERRLRRPDHFARYVGSAVALRLRPGAVEGAERRVEGELVSADELGIVVAVPAVSAAQRFLYEDLERAHTIFDWRAALAGSPDHERIDHRASRPSAAERSRASERARRPVSDAIAQGPGRDHGSGDGAAGWAR